MVAQLPHPITQKAETGGTQILGQLGLLGETTRILVLAPPFASCLSKVSNLQ